MARVTNALLDQRAYGKVANQQMVDPTFGGQLGYAPNLKEWVSNQAYIRRNLIVVLLEPPKFFKYLPDPGKWVDTLKAAVELHARSWEGLNAGITLEFDEHPVGGAGEMHQEIIDSKRARSEPVMTLVDKYGMPLQTFAMYWLQYGGMDPDTKFALMNTLTGEKPEDMLADMFTCSMAFIEPDPQHKRVVKSWVGVNMILKGTGDITGKRNLTEALEMSNLTWEWTGIFQFNLGSNTFTQTLLDNINMQNANPYLRSSPVTEVDASVVASETGYKKNVEDLGKSSVGKF